jgi:hypothetical protein
MLPLNTIPDYPPQPDHAVEAAARDVPAALQDMPNERGPGVADPGHGQRIVPAQRLVEELTGRGHTRGAAAWAVHRLVERGLLLAEGWPGVGHPVAPGGRPLPYDRLLVRSCAALWQWWRDDVLAAAGPQFTEADFERALTALDLALQDYAWAPGDNYLKTDSLLSVLHQRGITLALAAELCRRLIGLKVFTPWSRTIPAGTRYEPGYPGPVVRSEPETTHCQVTTRERWYAYLASHKRGSAASGPGPGPTPPAPASSAAKEEAPGQPAGGAGRGTSIGTDSLPRSPSGPGTPFLLTELQERVLQALDAKALTLDALVLKLHVDRSTLHKSGIKELMKRGLLANNRRAGGYYRPDAPPPKYAEVLGKKPG